MVALRLLVNPVDVGSWWFPMHWLVFNYISELLFAQNDPLSIRDRPDDLRCRNDRLLHYRQYHWHLAAHVQNDRNSLAATRISGLAFDSTLVGRRSVLRLS